MLKMNVLTVIALTLVIVGALNWGLVGTFGFDLVAAIFGPMSFLTRAIYTLVGLSAILLLIELAAYFHHQHEEHGQAHPA